MYDGLCGFAFLLFVGAVSSTYALDLNNLYLSGDFRLRYRYSDIYDQTRYIAARRFRINTSLLLHDTMNFVFGLGSGQQLGRYEQQNGVAADLRL